MANANDTTDTREPAPTTVTKGGFLQPLMVGVATTVISVLLLTGSFYYLIKSGKISLTSGGPTAPVKPEGTTAPPSHVLALEPMVVNLSDNGGKTFLRLGLTLRILESEIKKGDKTKEEKPKEAKGPSDAEAAARDSVLQVLGHQTADALLAPEGKELLKAEIKSTIALRDPELKVTDVYFTDFLVQR